MKRNFATPLVMALTVLMIAGISTSVSEGAAALGPVHRISADFQWCDPTTTPPTNCFEISTTELPGASGEASGGRVVFEKTVFVPMSTLFVTFSGQGDSHALLNGDSAALQMACTIDSGAGEAFCNPNTGLPGSAGLPGWVSLLKLPTNGFSGAGGAAGGFTGCGLGATGDGGGGAGDCHDNSLYATWCIPLENPGTQTIRLRLASSNGATVFYERAHIYMDMTPNRNAPNACVNIPAPPPTTGG